MEISAIMNIHELAMNRKQDAQGKKRPGAVKANALNTDKADEKKKNILETEANASLQVNSEGQARNNTSATGNFVNIVT